MTTTSPFFESRSSRVVRSLLSGPRLLGTIVKESTTRSRRRLVDTRAAISRATHTPNDCGRTTTTRLSRASFDSSDFFAEIDADGNGRITYTEFAAAMSALRLRARRLALFAIVRVSSVSDCSPPYLTVIRRVFIVSTAEEGCMLIKKLINNIHT